MISRRLIKDALKRCFFRFHRLGLRAGVAVYPVHYYSSALDLIALEKNRALWEKPSDLPGIDIQLDAQADRLEKICAPYSKEYAGNLSYLDGVKRGCGPGFGYIEAQALHAVIRHFKPARILEVGSGVSTFCSLSALKKNRTETGRDSRITCIEPYPSDPLRELAGSDDMVRLIERPVQAVPASVFQELAASDILFIDSSHVVKAGSDVNYLILEILPRLKAGVVVHLHDIYLPYDYQRDLLETFLHNNETSLLRAFLIFNKRYEILFCLSQLHYKHPQRLKSVFPEYNPQAGDEGLKTPRSNPAGHFPSSIWLRVLD